VRALGLALVLLPQLATAQLAPTPHTLDFGLIAPDCPTPRGFVGLENLGQDAVEVQRAWVEGPGFVKVGPDLPFRRPGAARGPALVRLAPGARATLPVSLEAPPEGPWQATLHMQTSAGARTVALEGAVLARVEDHHVQQPVQGVDLLVVLDDGPSMREEQPGIAANFQALVQFFRAQGLVGHIAVTTPSRAQDGRLLAVPGTSRRVLDMSEASVEEDFMALVQVGPTGPADHLGLWAMRRALAPDNLAGANAGFLTPGHVLSVMIVSDRPDLSPGTVDEYLDALRAVKGFRQTRLLGFVAIVGDARGGCSGAGGEAQPGLRYIEAARRTRGIFQSVCTADWSRALEDLSTAAFGFKWFARLSAPPVISTLEVYDDLERVPGTSPTGTVNWTYDDAGFRVAFSPFSTPEPGSQVEIDYRPRCQIARAIY